MADAAEPRRSQRDRKQAHQFLSVNSSLLKRKRSDATDDEGNDADDARSEGSDHEPVVDEADAEEGDYRAPKPSAKSPAKRKTKVAAAPKKPRAPKGTASKRAHAKPTGPLKPRKTAARKGKQAAGEGEFDAEKVAKDTKIAGDNPLFNAIMNPAAALQSTAEDYLESLSDTPGPSLAELINCILRACGCNDSVDEDRAVDYDGVVDALDDFTEVLKKDDTPIYPLTSKLPMFKKFRKSLSEFLERLIISSAELGSLYTSDLMPTLQTWVIAMSSSQLRSFRHTATVIALEVETALCDVAAAVEKEAEVISRQREGERKRKAVGNKGKAGNAGSARETELEKKAAEVRERRAKLAEFLKEFVDGVFVHRYRDLDPNIRAECVRAMGLWFKKYPGHFLDGAYLRYVGWVLSDAQTQVRLEAVRALALAYEQTAYIGAAALQHFTERFKPRLVEMAIGDIELSVRVAVVQVLQTIDGHGLLEDEQRQKLCLLVFDEEARVRRAVSGFVKGVWEETVEERLVGRKPSDSDKHRAGVKALGMLLVSWGRALDKTSDDGDDEDSMDLGEGSSKRVRAKEVATLVGNNAKGRTALVVEALWDEVDPVRDWETLLDVLLLDHSPAGEGSRPSSRAKGKQAASDQSVDEAYRLEEVEEAVLLEMFVASLRKALADAAGAKKPDEDTTSSDVTRALIKALPSLFVKHQTDEGRISDVLLIPQLMNLDLYLEMRMMTAYSSLWEEVTKQLLSHSSPVVLANAVGAIRRMIDTTSLSKTNSTKILELEDELSTSLRDAIAGRDEVEVASFTEDEVLSLAAICARLAALFGIRDMTSWMEEDEGGKQSSAWDIVSAIAERGRLGYKEEEMMVDRALHLLTLHLMWKARSLPAAAELTPEELQFRDKLKDERESLLEKLVEFAVGTQSNTVEGVRRAAFQGLLTLHILFCATETTAPDGSRLPTAALPLSLDDEVQYRCAGFVQAEIERYAEEFAPAAPEEHASSEEEDEEDEPEPEEPAKGKKGRGKKGGKASSPAPRPQSRSQLEKEYVFIGVVTTFLRAIRAGVIHFRHAASVLAHYGRLGPTFDLCSKVIVEILREEGMYKNNGEAVVAIICQTLQESFTLYLDSVASTEEHSIALGKALSACLLIRGAQLAVVRRLESKYVVEIQTNSLSWVGKRLGGYESVKNKKARNKCIKFFRVLLPLLSSLDTRDSLTIKAHLDNIIAQAKVEISPTSKFWESYRAYEKKLTAASTKEKGAGGRGRKRKDGGKSAEFVTTDDEAGEASEVEGLMANGDVPPPTRRKPRSRAAQNGKVSEGEVAATEDESDAAKARKAAPKPRPVRKRASPAKARTESPSKTPSRSPSPTPPRESGSLTPLSSMRDSAPPEEPAEPEEESQVLETPKANRKRGRSDDEDEEMADATTNGVADRAADDAASAGGDASQETEASEIQIRRKRVRH